MDTSRLNPGFQQLDIDYLYHFGLDSSMDLPAMFGDVRYVIFTRSFQNADILANEFTRKFYKIKNLVITCKPIAKDERYHLHKIDNTLIVSHGIGTPSLLICLNEIVKLLWHSQALTVNFFRISPSGGLGVEPPAVVIVNEALNNSLQGVFNNIELGTTMSYPTLLDPEFTSQVVAFAKDYPVTVGKVIATTDFYDGQARMNGAMPVHYSTSERDVYLQKAYDQGVRGFDMESLGFAGFCQHLAIPACEVNAILVDRFRSDVIELDKTEQISAFTSAANLVIDYILHTKKKTQ